MFCFSPFSCIGGRGSYKILLFIAETLDMATLVSHLRSYGSGGSVERTHDRGTLDVLSRLDSWLNSQVGKYCVFRSVWYGAAVCLLAF